MKKKELQDKIAKMEAGLLNPNITDSQKEIIRGAIAKAKKQLDEMDGGNPKKMDFPKNISQLKEFMKNNNGEKIYHQYSRKLREGETFPDFSKPEERIIRKIQTDSFATEREGKPDPSNYSWMEFTPAKNWTFDEKGFYFQNEYVKLNYYYEKPAYSSESESESENPKNEKNFFTLASDFTEVKAKLKKAVETNDRLEFLDDNLTKENLYFFLANKNTRNALVELYAGKDKFEDNFEEYKKSIKANIDEGKNILALFIGKSQLAASKSKEMESVMQNVLESILNAPLIHNNTDKLYHLHYFRGDTDVYISEIDFGTGIQDYGYVILNGDTQMAENGCVSIAELLKSGLELDYYFKPISLAEIKKSASDEYQEEEEEEKERIRFHFKDYKDVKENREGERLILALKKRGAKLTEVGVNWLKGNYPIGKSGEMVEFGILDNGGEFKSDLMLPDGNLALSLSVVYFTDNDGKNRPITAIIDEVVEDIEGLIEKYYPEISKKQPLKAKFAVGDFVSYEVGDMPVTKAEGEIKEIVILDKEIAYRIDAYFKDSDGWLFDNSKYNEQFEVVLRPSSKAKFLINKNLFESKRKKSKEATEEKSLKVEIRPASKTSSKFVVWDLETNQIFANEKFDSVEDAKSFVSQNKMELVNVVENKATEKPKKSKEKYTISSEKTDEIVATYIAAILFNHGNDVEIESIDETFDPANNILEIDFELSKTIQGKKVIKKMNMKHNVAGSSLDYYPGFEMPKEIDVKKYLMEHDFSSKTKKEVYPFASFLAEHSEKHVGKKVSQKTLHTIKPEEREKLKKVYKESHQQSKEEKQLSGKLKLTKYLKAQGVTQAMIDKVNKTGEGVTFRPVKRVARGTEFDRERHALKPGKRLSAKGTIYYEYRSDMSDVGKNGL